MSISSSATSWDPADEAGFAKAIRTLTLEAGTAEDAAFLAEFSACIRRGRLDAGELAALARKHLSIQAAEAMAKAARRHQEYHKTASELESLMTIIDDQIAEDDAALAKVQEQTPPIDRLCPNERCKRLITTTGLQWHCQVCGCHGDLADLDGEYEAADHREARERARAALDAIGGGAMAGELVDGPGPVVTTEAKVDVHGNPMPF